MRGFFLLFSCPISFVHLKTSCHVDFVTEINSWVMSKIRHAHLLEHAFRILCQRMCRQDGISRFLEQNSIINYQAAPALVRAFLLVITGLHIMKFRSLKTLTMHAVVANMHAMHIWLQCTPKGKVMVSMFFRPCSRYIVFSRLFSTLCVDGANPARVGQTPLSQDLTQ